MLVRGAGIVLLTGVLTGAAQASPPAVVPQLWATQGVEPAETDSLAVAPGADGRLLLFATAKTGDRVDVFDARTGAFVQHMGKPGRGPGEMDRPNGIAVVSFEAKGGLPQRHAICVVERDNARVQFFWSDTLMPAGMCGSDVLVKPYGAAIWHGPGDGATLYVTDVNPAPEARVHRFELARDGERISGRHVAKFGDARRPGLINTPESIAVDAAAGRLLICDEDAAHRDVKVYTLDGRFTGQAFGAAQVKREPEGIVVVDGANGKPDSGFIILTDQQKELSVWHIYTRDAYRHVGAFTGSPRIANTDGIAFWSEGAGEGARGWFYAVNDDAHVCAFDLQRIRQLAEQATPAARP